LTQASRRGPDARNERAYLIARLSNIGADISQFGNELLHPLPLQLRQKIFGANPGRFADLVAQSGKIKLAAFVSASGMTTSQNCKASLSGRRDIHLQLTNSTPLLPHFRIGRPQPINIPSLFVAAPWTFF